VAAAYDPGQWHDFGTSFAAAAGALLGLAFVAISFNLDPILKIKAPSGLINSWVLLVEIRR
jgi:hypothetical protein